MPPGGGQTLSFRLTSAKFALLPQSGEGFFAVDWLYASALDVVVAAVEHLPRLGHFLEIASHCVFDNLVGRASALGGEFVNLRLGFWAKAEFHERSLHLRGILFRWSISALQSQP